MNKGALRNMTSVYLVDAEGILCLYRIGSRVADHLYIGSAGGHFEKDELNDAYACALREMEEELGLQEADVPDLKLRYLTVRLKNGEIRQNYYFFGTLPKDRVLTSTEGILRKFTYAEAENLEMPGSAKHMLLHYLREGRFTDHLYGGITRAEGTEFKILEEF